MNSWPPRPTRFLQTNMPYSRFRSLATSGIATDTPKIHFPTKTRMPDGSTSGLPVISMPDFRFLFFFARAQMFNILTCLSKAKGNVREALRHCARGFEIMLSLADFVIVSPRTPLPCDLYCLSCNYSPSLDFVPFSDYHPGPRNPIEQGWGLFCCILYFAISFSSSCSSAT